MSQIKNKQKKAKVAEALFTPPEKKVKKTAAPAKIRDINIIDDDAEPKPLKKKSSSLIKLQPVQQTKKSTSSKKAQVNTKSSSAKKIEATSTSTKKSQVKTKSALSKKIEEVKSKKSISTKKASKPSPEPPKSASSQRAKPSKKASPAKSSTPDRIPVRPESPRRSRSEKKDKSPRSTPAKTLKKHIEGMVVRPMRSSVIRDHSEPFNQTQVLESVKPKKPMRSYMFYSM